MGSGLLKIKEGLQQSLGTSIVFGPTFERVCDKRDSCAWHTEKAGWVSYQSDEERMWDRQSADLISKIVALARAGRTPVIDIATEIPAFAGNLTCLRMTNGSKITIDLIAVPKKHQSVHLKR